MAEPAAPAGTRGPVDVSAHGERLEALLEASAVAGPGARDRAEQLVRLVVELYGAGLERVLEIMYEGGGLDDAVLDRLAADELVSGLLLVHGLHPYGVGERVERALEGVRPYLRSHGGDVELLGVGVDGTVGLRLLGHCDGCAGSTATLTTAVREAIEAAAPEVTRIDVAEPTAPAHPAPVGPLIPAESLTARLRGAPA